MLTRIASFTLSLLPFLAVSCSTPYYRFEIGESPTPSPSVTLTATPIPTATSTLTVTPVLPTQTPNIVVVTATPIPLPSELNSADSRSALFEKIKVAFNNRDSVKFYDLFPPIVSQQMPRSQFDQQFTLLGTIFGSIESGVYVQYEYKGLQFGRRIFELQYLGLTTRGRVIVRITVGQEGSDPYTFWGFQISSLQ